MQIIQRARRNFLISDYLQSQHSTESILKDVESAVQVRMHDAVIEVVGLDFTCVPSSVLLTNWK